MRPGGAQMICASFSPGGLFLATGSADHHVRVYMMDGKVSERVPLEISLECDRNMIVAH
jgi:bromodomain and WD repeat domain containing protein 1/3